VEPLGIVGRRGCGRMMPVPKEPETITGMLRQHAIEEVRSDNIAATAVSVTTSKLAPVSMSTNISNEHPGTRADGRGLHTHGHGSGHGHPPPNAVVLASGDSASLSDFLLATVRWRCGRWYAFRCGWRWCLRAQL